MAIVSVLGSPGTGVQLAVGNKRYRVAGPGGVAVEFVSVAEAATSTVSHRTEVERTIMCILLYSSKWHQDQVTHTQRRLEKGL